MCLPLSIYKETHGITAFSACVYKLETQMLSCTNVALDLYSYHEPFQNRDFTKWEWIHSRHYMGFLSLVSLGNLLEYGPIRTMRVSTRPDRLIKQTNTQSVSICRHNESLNVWNKHVWIDGHCHILLPY